MLQRISKTLKTDARLLTALVAALTVASLLPAGASAASPAVIGFGASPSFINLNRTTTLTLEIGTSVASGEDNYYVTVWAPDEALAASAWYNFTAVGSMSKVLGNASLDFMIAITQVGFYTLKAEWWNSTSAAFEPAAQAVLQTTNLLTVTTEFAAGSDPYTDLHSCQIAEEFQRGDGIIARGYVRYASTGEIVNGTSVPSAKGNVTGTLFATDRDPATKALNYHNTHMFWRAAWELDWDQPLGTFRFTVNAADGRGNFGTGISPTAGIYGSLKLIPAILPTEVWTVNATSDAKTSAFYPGETVEVVVYSYYDQHKNHNYNYTNTDAVNKSEAYRVGPDRSGAVTVSLGYGDFNSTSKTFATQLAAPTMAFDAATGTWRGTWTVPATGAFAGNISVKAFVTDGAPTPNAGSGSAIFSTLPLPAPVTNTVYENKTVYQNQTIEVAAPGTISATLGYGMAGGAIAIGAIVGYVMAQRRRGGGGAASTAASSSADKGEPAGEKKKGEEGWD